MRQGVDQHTGEWLSGWAHCVQSIQIILTTRIGARIWRRGFGAAVSSIQDANAHPRTLVEFYRSVAEALAKWEPGYKLDTIELKRYDGGAGEAVGNGGDLNYRDGVFHFDMTGTYYPNGHLGDFTIFEKTRLHFHCQ